MDIKIKKKPWYIRYKWYLIAGTVFVAFTIYVLVLSLGPQRLRVDTSSLLVAEVKNDKFREYVETEGVIQPILTLKINTLESGNVEQIVGEEGNLLKKGDTILVLSNPDLERDIEEQRDALEKQLITYREQEIEMEQKSLNLKQQALQNEYELQSISDRYKLDEKEYQMGYSSKAQFNVAEAEYRYKVKAAELQRQSLKHDSAMTRIRRSLIEADRERELKKFARGKERLQRLIVTAPMEGQLSFVNVTPGQRVSAGEAIGEIKVLSQYKMHTTLSEFYIDRIVSGLPATITYKNHSYSMKVTKVIPEVKTDRTFEVDLVFTGDVPDNVRIGKTFRVQIELEQPEQAIVIPRGDFYATTGGHWIYKVTAGGDKAIRTPVNIGRQNPQQYEVTGGLKPGDRVIVTGYGRFGDAQELLLQ